jgi:hypothetical protein
MAASNSADRDGLSNPILGHYTTLGNRDPERG